MTPNPLDGVEIPVLVETQRMKHGLGRPYKLNFCQKPLP